MNRKHCDPRRLERFLRQNLPEPQAREIETHVHECPVCQKQLDELSGGERWRSAVRRYLGGDGAESMHTADYSRRRTSDIVLDFLQPSANPDALGRLGTYEILEVLGRGGFGIVLKAFDETLHRPVAIKVLAPDLAASGAARKRFIREARAAAAVLHENIVPVHAVNAEATPPYLVMALIPGQTLQERIEEAGPLEVKEILRVGMQMAAGLAAAHAQGLVHRDIKPANILLENGIERVRITDFGLARAVDDASVTQRGALAGTPQYMAPEQARGDNVDQRADLFALGSTLYALCTGHAPFRGESGLAVLRQVCDLEAAPIRASNPDIPAWLEGIIRKLHAKDPARRFASAAEVADLFARCLAHVQQPDHQPLPPVAAALGRQVPRPAGARPRRAARFLAVASLLAVIGLWLAWPRPPLPDLPPKEAGPTETATLVDFDESLQEAKQRADALQHDLQTITDVAVDPIEPRLAAIRQRLAELQQELGPSSPLPSLYVPEGEKP